MKVLNVVFGGENLGYMIGNRGRHLDALQFVLGNEESKLYSGVCYIDRKNKIDYSTCIIVEFSTRKFSEEEIEEAVKKHPVLTWSGAFSPTNSFGLTMISKINGSLTGFTHGFPMDIIIPLLEKSGVKIKP